jgi:pyruvate dehydrogenase E2 component (dihydrolipoamide acetyltransferase)
MIDIVMPRLSDSMTEGTVVRWLKQPGEPVRRGEPLAEIETDKATITYESDVEGTITQLSVEQGQTVPVGTVIAWVEEVGATQQPAQQTEDFAPVQNHEPEPQAMTQDFPQDFQPTPSAELYRPETGEYDEYDDELAEPSGRVKASPIARRLAGKLGLDIATIHGSGPDGRVVKEDVEAAAEAAVQAQAQQDQPVHAPAPPPLPSEPEFAPAAEPEFAPLEQPLQAEQLPVPEPEPYTPQPAAPESAAPAPAAEEPALIPGFPSPPPAAPAPPAPQPGFQQPAYQQPVPQPQPPQPQFPSPAPFVPGMTGGFPAITPQQAYGQQPQPQQPMQPPMPQVQQQPGYGQPVQPGYQQQFVPQPPPVQQPPVQPPPVQQQAASPQGAPTATRGTSTPIEPTTAQQTVARRMAESKATAPEFFVETEVDMTTCVAYREQLRSMVSPLPSFNDFVIKAAAQALRQYPNVNASYKDGHFEQYSDVNVGIVVSSTDTLAVPTLFNVDQKGLAQIAAESHQLAEAVRTRTIQPSQMSGGTFSISNLGMYGVERFTAILNPPQAAILAVGSINRRAVIAEDGMSLVVRQIMNVTLTCDHRILYGAEAAEFLGAIKAWLESPQMLQV